MLLALNELADEVSALAVSTRAYIERLLREAFARELKRDNGLLDDLLGFSKTLGNVADVLDDFEDPDAEEEEDGPRPRRGDREDSTPS